MSRGFRITILLFSLMGFAFVWLFIGVVAIPPLGAIPDGVTLIVWKGNGVSNCESLDSVQRKATGHVNLLGRMVVLKHLSESKIARLPFSQSLHDFCD